jgi:hypothetical protein
MRAHGACALDSSWIREVPLRWYSREGRAIPAERPDHHGFALAGATVAHALVTRKAMHTISGSLSKRTPCMPASDASCRVAELAHVGL